jgi:hypothetical protein
MDHRTEDENTLPRSAAPRSDGQRLEAKSGLRRRLRRTTLGVLLRSDEALRALLEALR